MVGWELSCLFKNKLQSQSSQATGSRVRTRPRHATVAPRTSRVHTVQFERRTVETVHPNTVGTRSVLSSVVSRQRRPDVHVSRPSERATTVHSRPCSRHPHATHAGGPRAAMSYTAVYSKEGCQPPLKAEFLKIISVHSTVQLYRVHTAVLLHRVAVGVATRSSLLRQLSADPACHPSLARRAYSTVHIASNTQCRSCAQHPRERERETPHVQRMPSAMWCAPAHAGLAAWWLRSALSWRNSLLQPGQRKLYPPLW